ncbi:MAG TPA: thioredoxin domain-containing protein [Pyrinomonadaceae bacterium]|jgi:protein-disulfide isomerase
MSKNNPTAGKRNNPSTGKSYLPFIIIGVVLLAALGLAAMMFRSDNSGGRSSTNQNTTQNSADSNNASRAASKAPRAPMTVAGGAVGAQPPHTHGDANAPVTLEEFGDYQCPPCAAFHPELKKMEAQYGPRLRVVFRNLPLRIHQYAGDAARAAEAAGLQGKFWEMHDMLYEKQSEWEKGPDVRTLFANYARTLGLDVERFKKDLDSSTVTQRITADVQRADSLGAQGTPTIFVNGREMGGSSMQEIIQNTRVNVDAAMNVKTR